MTDDVDERGEEMLTGDARIVAEAKRRFRRVETWETKARSRFIDDVKFVNGDAYNRYQWPEEVLSTREDGDRPCLTINKTRQHCLHIINDARQNKTSIKVKPVGGQSDYDAAQIYEGIVRRIEYLSNADAIYTLATKHQVWGGIGYWRVVTDYVSADSFDQEIFLRPIRDPLTVCLDPDIQQEDGSDARFAIIFQRLSRDQFKAKYPKYADKATSNTLGATDETWTTDDKVMVAEYFRRSEREDKLIAYMDGDGNQQVARLSEVKKLGKEAVDLLLNDPNTKTRSITEPKIEWFKIIGEEIVERRDWPGAYIPIVRVVGEETVIDGELDRKGHVRALLDPQRMYNYNASAEVEFGALQGKSPYVAPAQAIEGVETYWETANTVNHSVLPYNHRDDGGNEIPAPQRAAPPGTAPAFIEGMEAAANDMQLVSGQYQAEMGAPSNERTGIAIQQRQRQGDNATYHYIDNLATAIRFTGKIIIDLAPKVYDTPRVLRILQEDGTELHIQVDPNAPDALKQIEDAEESLIQAVFNPKLGMYEVEADVGPAFATRRQEAFNALSQIAVQNKELMNVIGDLVLKAADFPMAEEAAERIKRLVPPQALGEGPSPAEVQLQQQLAAAHALLAKMTDELSSAKSRAMVSEEKRGTAMYDAVSRRMDVLFKHLKIPPDEGADLERQMLLEAHRSSLRQEESANDTALGMLDREHQIAVQPPQPEPQPQQPQQ